MRGSPLVCVLAVIPILIAGCASPGPDEPTDRASDAQEPDGADALPWGMTNCRYIVSWGWVDGDRLEPHLPDGFQVRRNSDVPPPSVQGDTWFGVDAMSCENGQDLNGDFTNMPVQTGFMWTAADPPQDLFLDGVPQSEHYVKWDVLVPDADRRTAFAERGVRVHDGNAEVVDGTTGPTATLTLDGIGTTEVTTVARGQLDPFDGSWVKFTPTEDGAAGWRAHAANEGARSTGEAIITFPEDSWMNEVTDGLPLLGGFHSGVWTVDEARVIFFTT